MKIFLTGKSGSGKSTIILKLIEGLKNRYRIAGIVTPEIKKDSRLGFEIIDIVSGKKAKMAGIDIKSEYRVSKYGVDVKAINEIVSECEKSVKKADIIIIDEIGKMELFSEKFKTFLKNILASDKILIATLHRYFISEFKDKGEVIEVTPENRDYLVKDILKRIRFR